MLYALLSLILLFILAVYAFMQRAEFGKKPSAETLERIKKSPNFRDGQFQNLSFTPQLTEGSTMPKVLYKFLFNKNPRTKPKHRIPSQKTDLKRLDPNENVLVWFGHSSYFMQIDGLKILVDPVFSGSASPVNGTTNSFAGSDVYAVEDFPDIDLLLISHDHWDHLDYKTVAKLRPKIDTVLTGLGTGAHLKSWGYDPEKIIEKDWNESFEFKNARFHITPARHFSGRGFKRNGAIWVSFVLEIGNRKIYLGGDSGFDTHFAEIGEKFGPFDLAILECGQYNPDWRYIHMLPSEIIPAAKNLNTKALLPVHWGKFSLAPHAWDEPILKVSESVKGSGIDLWTPMIGEKVFVDNPGAFHQWWIGIV
ncbi:MAG: MBL fold metallo-hydrolase [Flavobacterium sp.]|uniref:MBL fold metallo-hydrolase n=1 Tax=Flavobacterium sp. TaxID=239 RepID=UPI0011F7E17F|nr:MBL fold metallo-hydrolase [Flavobacterium sp.]RZJ65574.1 MAG: MBL fold metallo-hydrolase [Flavobacterium sp.]